MRQIGEALYLEKGSELNNCQFLSRRLERVFLVSIVCELMAD